MPTVKNRSATPYIPYLPTRMESRHVLIVYGKECDPGLGGHLKPALGSTELVDPLVARCCRIGEYSRERRSESHREPSAPVETKMSVLPGSLTMSQTLWSWAMSCVMMIQMVQAMSIERVTIRLGTFSFYEKESIRDALVLVLRYLKLGLWCIVYNEWGITRE